MEDKARTMRPIRASEDSFDLDKKYRADMLTYDSYQVTRADRDRVAKARLAENASQD